MDLYIALYLVTDVNVLYKVAENRSFVKKMKVGWIFFKKRGYLSAERCINH